MAGARPGDRRVLVVDDEPDVRDLLAETLRADGWEARAFPSGRDGLAALRAEPFAAAILDVNLDGESGYDVCREIRSFSTVPIIFLTARTDAFDHVLGLELGGDEYLTKPFERRILLAHLAAVTRHPRTAPPDGTDDALLTVRDVSLDPRSRRARVGEREVPLTRTEFDVLAVLMAEPQRAVGRDDLIDRVWGEWYSDDHVIDVTMGRLRKKLADAGADELIETLRGVGFRVAAG